MKSSILLALLFATLSASAQNNSFTNAGYIFNQTNTPNVATLIGNDFVIDGAIFGSGLPNDTNPNSINFPGAIGFLQHLTLSRLTGLRSSGVFAVSLPAGNNGENCPRA
jgi:hypothetical protein